ncbi:hypothetical protein N9C83_02840 [Opitutales bacterium]|nr:hypothetical protein [Opitutales bacterium]
MNNTLNTLRAKMAESTALKVILGTPVDSELGLYIFPYKITKDVFHHNLPDKEKSKHCNNLECLLIPNPANDYKALDKGLQFLDEQSFLAVEENPIKLTITTMDTATLTSIFTSAGFQLRLAVPFELG